MARLVQLAFRGVHGLSLPAQLLDAGTYGREVVGSAGAVHCRLLPGEVLVAQYGLRTGT